MSYSKNTGYDPVSSGDARSRGGSVEMKAVNRSALSSSTQQHLAETSEVEHLNGNDDGTPNMSEAHGLDLQRVILCYFGVLGFVTLAILYGAMLGIVVGTNSLLQSDIKVSSAFIWHIVARCVRVPGRAFPSPLAARPRRVTNPSSLIRSN